MTFCVWPLSFLFAAECYALVQRVTHIDPWGYDCVVEIQMMKQGIPKHMIWWYTSEGLLDQAWGFAKKTGCLGQEWQEVLILSPFFSFPQPCHNVQASPVFWVKCKSNHFLTTFAFVTLIQDTIISQVDYYHGLQTGISTFSFTSWGKCHRLAHLTPSQSQLHQVSLDRSWKPSLPFLTSCLDGLDSMTISFFQVDKKHPWDLEGEWGVFRDSPVVSVFC